MGKRRTSNWCRSNNHSPFMKIWYLRGTALTDAKSSESSEFPCAASKSRRT